MPQPRATEHYTYLLCADAKEGLSRGERGEVNVNCSHGCQCHVRTYTKSLMMEDSRVREYMVTTVSWFLACVHCAPTRCGNAFVPFFCDIEHD